MQLGLRKEEKASKPLLLALRYARFFARDKVWDRADERSARGLALTMSVRSPADLSKAGLKLSCGLRDARAAALEMKTCSHMEIRKIKLKMKSQSIAWSYYLSKASTILMKHNICPVNAIIFYIWPVKFSFLDVKINGYCSAWVWENVTVISSIQTNLANAFPVR